MSDDFVIINLVFWYSCSWEGSRPNGSREWLQQWNISEELKQKKKMQLTKFKKKMIKLLDEDMPSRRQVRNYQAELEDYQQELMFD